MTVRWLGLCCTVVLWFVVASASALQPVLRVEVTGVAAWEQEEVRSRVEPLRVKGWSEGDEAHWRDWILASGIYASADVQAKAVAKGVVVAVSVQKKTRVGSVRFEGNDALPSVRLRRTLRILEGQALDPTLVEAGRQRLLKLYRDEGFPNARVHIRTERSDAEFTDLTVSVQEGQEDRIGAIRWQGVEATERARLERLAQLKIGARWIPRRRHQVRRAIERGLRSENYLSSQVSVVFEPAAEGWGVVAVSVNRGPRYEVFFYGNEAISERKLRSLSTQSQGRVLGLGFWQELAARIRAEYQKEGFFAAEVSASVEDESGQRRKVNVRIREGPKFRLCSLQFVGNAAASARQLRAQMRASRSRWLRRWVVTDESLEQDLEAIESWYHRRGFLEAKVTDRQVILDWENRCIALIVFVAEGQQTRIGEIRLEGLPGEGVPPRVRAIRAGEPLDPAKLEEERQQLERALQKQGYLDAKVECSWEVAGREAQSVAVVRFLVHAGPRYELGAVVVGGNFDTRSSIIVGEARLRPGQTIDPDQLTQAQLRVQRLGLFRGVEMSWEEDLGSSAGDATSEPGTIQTLALRRVKIVVDERPPLYLGTGGGFNTRDGFRGFFEMGHLNLAHRAARLSLRTDVALDPSEATVPNEYLADLGFRLPQFAGSNWAFRSSIVAQRSTRSIDQFSIERLAVLPAVERRIGVNLLAGLELQAETARVFDIQPDVRNFNPEDEGRLSSWGFGPFFLYDGRDDPFMPTRGLSESLRMRIVPSLPGVDIPFVKLQWLHSHYVPLWWGLGGAYALRVGWAKTLSGEVVPLRERFFTGGRASVRGFSENSIGPKGAPILHPTGQVAFRGGNPLGGDLLLNSNLELRFPLLLDAIGVLFVDGGGVYLQDRSVSWKDYRRSAGLGLLYRTPVGPLGLHYGFKLDRRSGEDIGAVHFSIGVPF